MQGQSIAFVEETLKNYFTVEEARPKIHVQVRENSSPTRTLVDAHARPVACGSQRIKMLNRYVEQIDGEQDMLKWAAEHGTGETYGCTSLRKHWFFPSSLSLPP